MATEKILMSSDERGKSRQEMHEVIRRHSMTAWDVLQREISAPNPLPDLLAGDPTVRTFLSEDQVRSLLDASGYTGDAPERALDLAALIHQAMGEEAAP